MHSVAHRRDTSGEAVRVEQEVAVLVLVVPVHTDGAAEVSDEERALHHPTDRRFGVARCGGVGRH